MLQETFRIENIIDELLLEMEKYDWSSVGEIPRQCVANQSAVRPLGWTARRLGVKPEGQSLHFDARQIIRHAGITLDGSILEFDAGSSSIGAAHPGLIAVDSDPRNVRYLRHKGIKAIIGTIEELPFPANSFDYVLAFSPQIVRGTRGWKWVNGKSNRVEVGADYRKEIVRRAIEIARKKVLLASIPIAVDPPYVKKAEKIVSDPRHHYYYVVYAAS